jgi:hypothetical protein
MNGFESKVQIVSPLQRPEGCAGNFTPNQYFDNDAAMQAKARELLEHYAGFHNSIGPRCVLASPLLQEVPHPITGRSWATIKAGNQL